MPQPNSISPPITPFVDLVSGVLTKEAWRFLFSLNRNSSEAASGEIATPPGSGLEGGGFVADGVDLSIAPNGVSNAMLRESLGTSVIGRYQNSTGDVADIRAVANYQVLTRESNLLAFRPVLNGVAIGTTLAAPLVRADSLRIDQAPIAETVVCTHTLTISVNGTDYKIPIVAA